MAPHRTLAGMLRRSFSDPRLAQLFGRYATYVGGSPYASPAILSLIWQAEAQGVWSVEGRHAPTGAGDRQTCRGERGAVFALQHSLPRESPGRAARSHGVETAGGHIPGDIGGVQRRSPRAGNGLLGEACATAVATTAATSPRSLSAYVQAFAAAPTGLSSDPSQRVLRPRPARRIRRPCQGRDATGPHALYLRAGSRPCRRPATWSGSKSS